MVKRHSYRHQSDSSSYLLAWFVRTVIPCRCCSKEWITTTERKSYYWRAIPVFFGLCHHNHHRIFLNIFINMNIPKKDLIQKLHSPHPSLLLIIIIIISPCFHKYHILFFRRRCANTPVCSCPWSQKTNLRKSLDHRSQWCVKSHNIYNICVLLRISIASFAMATFVWRVWGSNIAASLTPGLNFWVIVEIMSFTSLSWQATFLFILSVFHRMFCCDVVFQDLSKCHMGLGILDLLQFLFTRYWHQ